MNVASLFFTILFLMIINTFNCHKSTFSDPSEGDFIEQFMEGLMETPKTPHHKKKKRNFRQETSMTPPPIFQLLDQLIGGGCMF